MPKTKNDNPMLVNFNNWEECINALGEEYILTLKDMCKILKCSRAWATRYLKPHLHYIYVGNGAGKGANYLLRARNALNQSSMTETTWYSMKEFTELIKSNLGQCTRQTILVPVEKLIAADKLDYFLQEFMPTDVIIEEFRKNENIEWFDKAINKHDKLIEQNIDARFKDAYNDSPSCYKRTLSPTISFDINLKDLDLHDLMAVHDLKDYGDADETIYRELFLKGCVRTVLRLPDKFGEISEKVYYINLEDDFEEYNDSVEKILVKYSNYVSL